MPTSCNYNCTELPEHEQIDCGEWLKGGISAVGVLECDHEIADFTSAVETQAAIDAGKLTIFKAIKGQMPDASPLTVDNPVGGCGSPTKVINFDRTASWTDANVTAGNVDTYNALNRRNAGLILYQCDSGMITVIDEDGGFVSTQMIPESGSDLQKFTTTYSWRKFDGPPMYEAPAGIYE